MEESKSSEPSRCPCGFWGSPSTLGLCSTCYKAHQEKTQDALKSTPDHMIRKQDEPCTRRNKFSIYTHTWKDSGRQLMSRSHDLESTNNTPQPSSSKDSSVHSAENLSEKLQEHMKHIPVTETVCIDTSSELQTTCLTTNKNFNSSEDNNSNQNGKCSQTDTAQGASASGSSTTDVSRGIKRPLEPDSTPESTPEKGKQKNKKRCFQCNAKLELAQRQIGRCRCELIFCSLHRLPELHNCEFDHKEDGRLQARQKMVKPTRHLGNEFRRLESDS
ncbi:AN1-type zinc finger protein 3-like isoform X1 [Argopecten irradians]|uniref:AN1-type zinc finger protein 3-like isoform X1 n=1 Tax=Argopecten irradians TaxID=31199 RepID=UPI003720E8C8